ncbi:MAG: hypothetical protein KDD42_10410, partial [Bdellovibrionales bacterium]|nr:hypothetical protein [Bdellovibrionales bacterium]
HNPHPLDYWSSDLGEWASGLAPFEVFLRQYVLQGEISPDPGGLEARWIIKAALPVGFFLVLLQGIALLVRQFAALFGIIIPEEIYSK